MRSAKRRTFRRPEIRELDLLVDQGLGFSPPPPPSNGGDREEQPPAEPQEEKEQESYDWL